ncbi:MAG: hypothetical protein WB495_17200, partial [Xanthobacteraceae bacterium]
AAWFSSSSGRSSARIIGVSFEHDLVRKPRLPLFGIMLFTKPPPRLSSTGKSSAQTRGWAMAQAGG